MNSSRQRVIVASMGTFLEWAEFTYYAYIAAEIANLFFPSLDKRAGLLASLTVFALGYLMRPAGAIYFGYIGDKFGRRSALQSSILLMGLASMAIGLLPTYSQIGLLAPLLLTLFRCLQGFAVSGEFNGSAIYLIEHANNKPCRAGSWTGLAAALGMMFGSLMAIIISLPLMPSWSWRIK